MSISRKRLALVASAMAAIGAVAALAAGVTFGLFTSTQTQNDKFMAGTVSLTQGASTACLINNPPSNDVKPGDSGTCTFATVYSGNPAYEALDIFISTMPSPTGSTNLYTPGLDPAAGLALTLTDTLGTSFTLPATATGCPSYYGPTVVCYELDNVLLKSTGFLATNDTFTLTWSLPLSTGNQYQGSYAAVTLTAHAVQQRNNTLSCTTTPTAGQSCYPSGSFSWS